MFKVMFILWLIVLGISLLLVTFKEYKEERYHARFLSATKIHLWLLLSYSWFFNYVNALIYAKPLFIEKIIGASVCFLLAAMLIFVCYPKMSKVCQLFFVKRYALLMVLCFISLCVANAYLGVIIFGALTVTGEIYQLRKRKV